MNIGQCIYIERERCAVALCKSGKCEQSKPGALRNTKIQFSQSWSLINITQIEYDWAQALETAQ